MLTTGPSERNIFHIKTYLIYISTILSMTNIKLLKYLGLQVIKEIFSPLNLNHIYQEFERNALQFVIHILQSTPYTIFSLKLLRNKINQAITLVSSYWLDTSEMRRMYETNCLAWSFISWWFIQGL